MRIMGIDPGIARTGWGVIEEIQNSKFKIQNYGCIETSPKDKIQNRLEKIHNEIIRIIKVYAPDEMAVEEIFFNTNAKTAFIVGQARGVVLLTAAQQKLPIATYTPLQVKIAVTGYGRAEKQQVGKMVKNILLLKDIPRLDDTTDALAIAITHAFSIRLSS